MTLLAYEDGTDSVPKRRRIKFRRRETTQKKTYNTNFLIIISQFFFVRSQIAERDYEY